MANIDRVIDELNAKIALKKQADREAKVAEQNQLREAQARKDTANVAWTKTRSTLAKCIEEINNKLSDEVALKLGDAENSTNSLILLQQYVVFAKAPARQSSLLKLIFTPKLDGETLVTVTGQNKHSEKHPSSTIGKNEIDSLLARLLLQVELG